MYEYMVREPFMLYMGHIHIVLMSMIRLHLLATTGS